MCAAVVSQSSGERSGRRLSKFDSVVAASRKAFILLASKMEGASVHIIKFSQL